MKDILLMKNRFVACLFIASLVGCAGSVPARQATEEETGATAQPDENHLAPQKEGVIDWVKEHPKTTAGGGIGAVITTVLIVLGIVKRKEIGAGITQLVNPPQIKVQDTSLSPWVDLDTRRFKNVVAGQYVVFQNPAEADPVLLPKLKGYSWVRYDMNADRYRLVQNEDRIFVKRDRAGEQYVPWELAAYNNDIVGAQHWYDYVYGLSHGKELKSYLQYAKWMPSASGVQVLDKNPDNPPPPSDEPPPPVANKGNVPPPDDLPPPPPVSQANVQIAEPGKAPRSEPITGVNFSTLPVGTVVTFFQQGDVPVSVSEATGPWSKLTGGWKYRRLRN